MDRPQPRTDLPSSDHRMSETSMSSAISIIHRMVDEFLGIAGISSVKMNKVSAEAVIVSSYGTKPPAEIT